MQVMELLTGDGLDHFRHALEGSGVFLLRTSPEGELAEGFLPCPGPIQSCCPTPPPGEAPLTPCAHGYTRACWPLAVPGGVAGYLWQLRAPGSSGPDLGLAVADLLTREARSRFELESTIKELLTKYEELTVLYDSASTITTVLDLDEACERILDLAAEILDVDHASLMLVDETGEFLDVKAARGTRSDAVGKVRVPLGEEISGLVAREGKAILVEDIETHPVFQRMARTDGTRSLLSVPLKVKDKILGVLNVNNKNDGTPFHSGDQKLLMALADMAAISIENARTYRNAITDRLTRLYNYGYFKEQLEKKVADFGSHDLSLSLLMFDIDHFKNFNDKNGHELANVALVGVANICVRHSRQKGDRIPDLVARYGGEEFMILLEGVGKEQAAATAERIRKLVEDQHFEGGHNQPLGKLTISMGVAGFPEDATSADELVNRADQALYKAKHAGRNNVQLA
ncbi:sensor domain-containing diguanylate cyclase [bacterium CPR1]|nr:sensor domain-containing diguanylate cyclase [bacterium CPR1]